MQWPCIVSYIVMLSWSPGLNIALLLSLQGGLLPHSVDGETEA